MKKTTRLFNRKKRTHRLLSWEQAIFGRSALLARRLGKPTNHIVNAISGEIRHMGPILELLKLHGRALSVQASP
jgi:hypothetical protein